MALAPILYVEDEKTDVLLTQLAFERVGIVHSLQVVTNGKKAMEYLAGTGVYANREQYPFPCLILLDLNLPIKSGLEVLQWIRAQPQLRALPVVVYTSSGKTDDFERARELGADDYVVKSGCISETDKMFQSLRDRWLNLTPQHHH